MSGQISDAYKRHKEDRAAAVAAATAAAPAAAPATPPVTPAGKGAEGTEGAAAADTTAAAAAATAQGEGDSGGATPAVSTAAAAAAAAGELKFAAIVDPPRSGVHAKCLRSIRSTKAIKRLVRWAYFCWYAFTGHHNGGATKMKSSKSSLDTCAGCASM